MSAEGKEGCLESQSQEGSRKFRMLGKGGNQESPTAAQLNLEMSKARALEKVSLALSFFILLQVYSLSYT